MKSTCLVCKREIIFDEESGIWRHFVGSQHSAYPVEKETAQQSVQADASPETCEHGNLRGRCYVEICSFSKYGERR